MRSGRSLLILILIAAGLGAYIYFVEADRDPLAEAGVTREKVFTLETGSIDGVTITNADAEVTTVAKHDATWSLEAPEAADADTTQVSTLTSSLESLERTKMIDEQPESVAPFGLDPARIRVSFTTAGDTTPKVLLIGNKTPTGGDLYAKVDGAPAVFLIASYLEDTFNKTPFDLRDKTVLAFTRDGVNGVTLAQGNTRVALEKSATGDWRLSAPTAAKADGAAVDGLVGQVFQARMTSLAASSADANLREYGLDRPTLVATIATGSSKAELAIGSQKGDTEFYARDLSRPLVFTVEKTLVDELQKKGDDFRIKDIFAYRSFSATGMDVTYNGVTYTFAKTKADENSLEHWSQTDPKTDTTLDEPKFDDFLTTMSNLRATSFVSRAATGGETLTITARFGSTEEPQTETVTLRKSGTTVQAIRDGEPGAAEVNAADFDRALGLFKELTGAK